MAQKKPNKSGLSLAYDISKRELQRLQKLSAQRPLTKAEVETLTLHAKVCQQYMEHIKRKTKEDTNRLSTMSDEELLQLLKEELSDTQEKK
jgi:hypothetical protein